MVRFAKFTYKFSYTSFLCF